MGDVSRSSGLRVAVGVRVGVIEWTESTSSIVGMTLEGLVFCRVG